MNYQYTSFAQELSFNLRTLEFVKRIFPSR